MSLVLSTLALLPSMQGVPAQSPFRFREPRPRPNIVMILADDFGVGLISAYGEASVPPCTPNVDGLASSGLLFRNAWANPVCVPTRAAILTGRHGFRTGLGTPGANARLPLSETILPEVLTGYTSTFLGKWHLAGNMGTTHPNASGFDHYAGSLGGEVQDYSNWAKVTDGAMSISMTYVTVDTADDAIAALQSTPEPFFLFLSFNAPHTPWHEPPASVCAPPACPQSLCGNLPPNPSTSQLVKAMTEAMDAQIGRVLNVLDGVDPNAYVVFMGDNGTARQATEPPFVPSHAKGTVYEGGANVPLIVRGPGVVIGECSALVSAVDLFATFGELARTHAASEDSVSLVPYFFNPTLSLRATVYTEMFSPNGGTPPYPEHDRAVRDERYKLIRRVGVPDEFYDLLFDPFEGDDLLPMLTPAQQIAYDTLLNELVALGVD